MNKIKEYLQNAPKIHFSIYGKPLYFKNSLSKDIDIGSVCKRVENILPASFFKGIAALSFGEYETLNDRGVDSVFGNNIIYLTNIQENEEDIIENIIHETAHSLEERFSQVIYSDGLLKKEFLKKRKQLYSELSKKYTIDEKYFKKTEFSKTLDLLFYKKIGYDTLSFFTEHMFISPYSATSLREYFSEGFEKYYMGESGAINELCPELYKKIQTLEEITGK